MRIYELDENFASQLIKGATKLAPNLSKSAAPAIGQTFNLAAEKPVIIARLTRALKTPGQPVDMQDIAYDILRGTNTQTLKVVDQLGYTQAQKAAYNSAMQNWPKSNGGWAQKDFGPAKAAGQGSSTGGRTENYYATIAKDRANLDKFMNSFPDLDKRIQQLAQQTGQPISYKTNATLTGLAADSDNIKFFYYDPKLKPQIEATVKQWLQANGIQTNIRAYDHGVDVGRTSFGTAVSNHVNDAFNKMFTQNGTKYTPEQYYQWLGNNFKQLVSQVTVK
jgi:hypothetical protein